MNTTPIIFTDIPEVNPESWWHEIPLERMELILSGNSKPRNKYERQWKNTLDALNGPNKMGLIVLECEVNGKRAYDLGQLAIWLKLSDEEVKSALITIKPLLTGVHFFEPNQRQVYFMRIASDLYSLAHIMTGKKVREGNKAGRDAKRETRSRLWDKFVPWLDRYLAKNPNVSLTEARKRCAEELSTTREKKCSYSTVKRRTPNYIHPKKRKKVGPHV